MRVRVFRTASGSVLLLALTWAVSFAGGMNLRWTRCYGDGGALNRQFACNSNTGTNVLVASFVPPSDISQTSSIELDLDITTAAATLPAWWQFKNVGTCRQNSLGFNSSANPSDVVCVDWGSGMAVGGIGSYTVGGQGPHTARIKAVVAVPQSGIVDIDHLTEYFACNLTINNAKTVGSPACSGCATPACIGLSSLKINYQSTQSVTLTTPANESFSNYVFWNGTTAPPLAGGLCLGDTAGFPVATTVVGRGQVARSRVKSEYPPGSPISLTAVPSPGDHFIAWSGDTATTAATLDIVVTHALAYTATFERDPAWAADLQSVEDEPGDQGSQVRLDWARSLLDTNTYPGLLCCYEIQRQPVASPQAPWSAVGTVPCDTSTFYEQLVATGADSTLADPANFRFRVVAKAAADTFTWISDELVGHSVDNLAPPAPSSVSGTMSSGFATFFWPAVNVSDLSHYAVYRGLEDPPIDSAHRIGTTQVTGYNDAPGYLAHYEVTAVDVHGNESPATAFVPQNNTGVGDRSLPSTLTITAPSPTSGSAALTIGFPRESHAVVEVRDAQGRTVRRLYEGSRPAGWLDLRWDARDARGGSAPAGIYFVQVRTAFGDRIRRLVLLP